jgi:hypothetical protein
MLADSSVTVRVTVTARDGCDLLASASEEITVADASAPEITCPEDIGVVCTGMGGTPADDPALAPFFEGVSAADACDTSLTITNDAPEIFPLGDTEVTFTATDGSGNSASCMATVTVIDTIPPSLEVTLNRTLLWPPNHKFHVIEADVTVTDDCDPEPTFVLLSIESNESPNGRGDGNTQPDVRNAAIGDDDTSFELRAERSGQGEGRVYTIRYRASDSSGNEALRVAHVHVPHDRGGHAKSSNGYAIDGAGFSNTDRVAILVSRPRLRGWPRSWSWRS